MQSDDSSEHPLISVVIPAYNESQRLEQPMWTVARHLASLPGPTELVLVDDGSVDGTFERIQAIAREIELPVRAIRYPRNRGKGYALKVGFAHAQGERILFTDMDLSTPIDALRALDSALDEGYDLAIGSRKIAGAEIRVHQPWYRESMGRVFTWLVRASLADVSDVTCGFKLFRGEAGRNLFAQLRVERWAFDAEILFLAERRGYRIAEVPVRWEDQAGTKVRLLRDAASSCAGLLQIAANHLLRRYDRPTPIDADRTVWSNEVDPPQVAGIADARRS